MSETIIAVGGGGYNLAVDLKEAGLFTKAQFTVCDTDENSLKELPKSQKKVIFGTFWKSTSLCK